MKIENEFTVAAPVEDVWDVLIDVERVAPCLPGASIRGSRDGAHEGAMTIKVGPVTTSYLGTVRIEEADERARRAVLRAQARDSRGQGTAAATITSSMEAVPAGTQVRVETDMRVTGAVAQFGRGVMEDVSAKLMASFAECVAAEISAAPRPKAEPAGDGARQVGPRRPAAVPPPGPAGEEAEAAARGAAPSTDRPGRERRTEDVLDLGAVSREAVLRRAIPVAAAVVLLVIVARLLRRVA